MNRNYKYAALAAAMTLAWGTAAAQTSTRAERAEAARTERAEAFAQTVSYKDYLKGEHLRASRIVGARVRNAAGDNLGEIEELVVPTRSGDKMLVILSVGGVLDVGDKLVALPYDDLRVSPDGDTLYIDRSAEQLKAAPAFAFDADRDVETRAERRDPEPRADTSARVDRDRDVDNRRDVDDRRDVDTTPRTVDRDVDTTPRRTAEPAVSTPRQTAPRVAAAKASNVVLDGFDYRASDLIGATVLDDRGESVAKVDDIVVSTDDDKLHAVLAIGGFAGFGAKLVSLPLDDLHITANGDDPQIRIPMTGEQLSQVAEERPDFRYERQVAQAPDSPRG